jgi:hypothetical protein
MMLEGISGAEPREWLRLRIGGSDWQGMGLLKMAGRYWDCSMANKWLIIDRSVLILPAAL